MQDECQLTDRLRAQLTRIEAAQNRSLTANE